MPFTMNTLYQSCIYAVILKPIEEITNFKWIFRCNGPSIDATDVSVTKSVSLPKSFKLSKFVITYNVPDLT